MQEKNATTPRGKTAPQRSNCCAGQSPDVCGKHVMEVSARVLGGRVSRNGRRWLPPKFVGKADLGGVWPSLGPMESVCFHAQRPWNGMCRGVRAAWRALFLPDTERTGDGRTFSPFFNADIRTPLFSADVLKKCALIALHVTAEGGRDGGGCHVPRLGDEWIMGCPRSPTWESEGEAWSEDDSASSGNSREGNVCNDALHVIGLCGPDDKISLFLKDWELAKVALSCHMALDMLCQGMTEAW